MNRVVLSLATLSIAMACHTVSAGFVVSGIKTPDAVPGRDRIDLFLLNTGGGTGTQLKIIHRMELQLDSGAKVFLRVDDLTDAALTGAPDGVPDTYQPLNEGASAVAGFSSVRVSSLASNNVYVLLPAVQQPHPYMGGVSSIIFPDIANTGTTNANTGIGFRFARLFVSSGADGTMSVNIASENASVDIGPTRLSALTGITPEPASLIGSAACTPVLRRRRA